MPRYVRPARRGRRSPRSWVRMLATAPPNGPRMAHRWLPVSPRRSPRPRIRPLTWGFVVERVTGIEPALSAWEAEVLPLNYTRMPASADAPDLITGLPRAGSVRATQ